MSAVSMKSMADLASGLRSCSGSGTELCVAPAVVHCGVALFACEPGAVHTAFHCEQIKEGARTYLVEKNLGEIFRADAACNNDSIVLGGRFLHKGGQASSAPWFQLVLSRTEVPWLFNDSGSAWASTSAELLASLVALYLIKRDFQNLSSGPGMLRTFFGGGTETRQPNPCRCGYSRQRFS